MTPETLREAVYVLAQRTGWGLNELLALPEDELMEWLEAGKRVNRLQEKARESGEP